MNDPGYDLRDQDFDPYSPPKAPVGYPRPEIDSEYEPVENPWTAIWTRPRATIRQIVNTDPTKNVMLLAVLSGMSGLLPSFMVQQLDIVTTLVGMVIGGSIFGLLMIYFNGFMLTMTGRWIGGQANQQEVRAAYAWASVPVLPVFALELVTFFSGGMSSPIYLLLVPVQFVLGIWSFVLSLKCLGEVHRFSAMTAFGAALLSGLVLGGIFLVILIIVMAMGFNFPMPK
jgi:hypothetical protein